MTRNQIKNVYDAECTKAHAQWRNRIMVAADKYHKGLAALELKPPVKKVKK